MLVLSADEEWSDLGTGRGREALAAAAAAAPFIVDEGGMLKPLDGLLPV